MCRGLFYSMALQPVMNQTVVLSGFVSVNARVVGSICGPKGRASLRKVEEWKSKQSGSVTLL